MINSGEKSLYDIKVFGSDFEDRSNSKVGLYNETGSLVVERRLKSEMGKYRDLREGMVGGILQ